ncbi:MAG: DUF429 domain-containing protein [Chromatiales bacterium]|nr:DUF429 domain-containing protein [Chromatiales bacterium]
MILAGVDLAWQSNKNPTALAWGVLHDGQLHVEQVRESIVGLPAIHKALTSIEGLVGIAIDASLIIPNQRGFRNCEREIASVYGSRGAGCHPTNLSLYPDADSVRLSRMLVESGFDHLQGKFWQIECYPHPALIEVFGLEQRLKYKRGSVAEKRAGQQRLAELLRQLTKSSVLALKLTTSVAHIIDQERIAGLRGEVIKQNENALDALVCLYIAGLYAIGRRGRLFGDKEAGYIWIPSGHCI